MRRKVRGRPTSPTGASSFHLWWDDRGPFDAVEVTLTVENLPRVPDLYFWALQVSFVGPEGPVGAAHLGLQWNRRHPESRAVNWGGYRRDGSILEGTDSTLPSTPHDPNTRDFPWSEGVAYRLRVEPGDRPGWWRGVVVDTRSGETVTVRELAGGGDRLADPVQWSEVFAPCDAPSVVVAWADPAAETPRGRRRPTGYRVTYQSTEAGGCSNTNVEAGSGTVRQITTAVRQVPDGARLPVP